MKRTIIHFSAYFTYLTLLLSVAACKGKPDSNSTGSGGNGNSKQTTISYEINLDDSKKVKEEEGGKKLYYTIPVNTKVVITTKVKGPKEEEVKVGWGIKAKNASGGVSVSGEILKQSHRSWEYQSTNPYYIEVTGVPKNQETVNGVALIVNEEKTFVLEWK